MADTKPTDLRKRDIQLIKMGQAALGWDDDTYRDVLKLRYGQSSATALTWQQRQDLIAHMKASGFVVKRKAVSQQTHDAQLLKLRAIWYALADVGAVTRPANAGAADEAMNAWACRQVKGLQALRWASGYQMQRLIEAAKRWAERVGAHLE
jgi:phage gp16-like protein